MSSSDIAISVRGIAKAYTIRHAVQSATTLTEEIMNRLRHPIRRDQKEIFWALKDVSFEVRKGEELTFRVGKAVVARYAIAPTAPRPYFWPLHCPSGGAVTRSVARPVPSRSPAATRTPPPKLGS